MIDLDAFSERAAIMEFDAGMSRFQAETRAAAEQGKKRWEVLDEIRERHSARQRDQREAMDGKPRQNDVPGVQPAPKEENRSVPERHAEA